MTSLRKFVLQRLALIPVTVFFMVTVIFFILRVVPGRNPINAINPQLPQAVVEAQTEALGLNKPILEQYFDFLVRIVNLDFGTSFKANAIVIDELVPRFAATIELSLVAVFIGLPLGIYVGSYAGRWRETKRDHLLRIYSIAVFAVPIFLFGIYLQHIFGIVFFNEGSGWITPNHRTGGGVSSAINAITGIYIIDSLFFSGPIGWELIFLLIASMLMITGLISWYLVNRKSSKTQSELDMVPKRQNLSDPSKIILAFILFLIAIAYLINEVHVKGFADEVFIELLKFLNIFLGIIGFQFELTPIPELLYLPVTVFFYTLGIGIWPLILLSLTKDVKSIVKKVWIFAIIISFIPTILYFWNSWYIGQFNVSIENEPVTGFFLFSNVVEHLILPGFALGLLVSGVFSRVVRTNMIVAMNESYIDASRARGIEENRIVYDYALKNATIPAIPLFGTQFALLMAGALLTETTFSYSGLGYYLFQAIQAQDYPQIQGAIVFLSFAVAVVSFITDLLYASLDPRVRL